MPAYRIMEKQASLSGLSSKWVPSFIPPLASRADAKAKFLELVDKGIEGSRTTTWVIYVPESGEWMVKWSDHRIFKCLLSTKQPDAPVQGQGCNK